MNYVISFDTPSSHVLDKTGLKSTGKLDEAMKFTDHESALKYIEKHNKEISQVGTGAVPSKLS
ncbi:hypothetical protein [Celeribacter naphthalenivorans]|uniref:hypothetical protein n=1 Tax=Celeribacter naphthalenivorans TaxID=1614694 RepID=UPI001CFB1392|nr:hypothetical protein [Celeribacter naphthalenivorans]